MRVAFWNHHSPYWSLVACAFPEMEFHAMPTRHAPDGWRFDQRPKPDNVMVIKADGVPHDVDVVVCQTGDDISAVVMDSRMGHPQDVPALYVAHNRWEYDTHCADALNVWGWPLICISEMKAATWRNAGYTHPIGVILPYVDTSLYGGWTGEGGYILTVANNLRRPLFDLDAWLEATRGLPVKLVGEGNEGIRGSVGPAESWEQLKSYYRCAAAYLSVNKWPNEDGYNLSLLEAMATGTPCLAIDAPNTPKWVAHMPGASGEFLRRTLQMFYLTDHAVRTVRQTDHALNSRGTVIEQFPLSNFRDKWLSVLERVTA